MIKSHKNKSIWIYIIKVQNKMVLIKFRSMNMNAHWNLLNKLNCLKFIFVKYVKEDISKEILIKINIIKTIHIFNVKYV